MTYDRNYLSMLSDRELVYATSDRNYELAIVLAERLSELLDVEAQLDEAKNEIEDLNLRLTSCMDQALRSLDEIEVMQAQLDAE